MKLHVERDASDVAGGKLKRFHLDGRRIDVIENLDRWLGPDYAYFKIMGDDGNLYILRLDEARDAWELTMFQRRPAEDSAAAPGCARPADRGKE